MYNGENDLQLERINVYFTEARDGRYVPRSIFTDLDQSSVNKVRCSTYGRLFNPELMTNGKTGASNNFAKGFFTEGLFNCQKIRTKLRVFRYRDVARNDGIDP